MRNIIKLIFALFALTLFANETFQWEENGIAIRQGVHIEWQRAGDVGIDGEVIFVWSDARTGDRDVYMQKVDTLGNALWGESGLQLTPVFGRQEDPVLVSDGLGGAFVAWIDYRDDPAGDVYGQYVNAAGEIQWNINGVALAVNDGAQQVVNMARGAEGYAFVIWNDNYLSDQGDIYGTVLSTSGPLADPNTNGFPVANATGTQAGHSIETSGNDVVVVWEDGRDTDNQNIYGQRFDTNMNPLWTPNGKMICSASALQEYPKVAPANGDTVVVSWSDERIHNVGDIYAQMLDGNGDAVWAENGIPVTDMVSEQTHARIKTDGESNVFVIWEDSRNPGNNYDIYMQKFDYSGMPIFAENGIAVVQMDLKQIAPRLTNDGVGGIYIVWSDERNGGFPLSDVYFQHLKQDNTFGFPANGLPLSNNLNYQEKPLVRNSKDGHAMVVWASADGGSVSLNVQMINDNSGVLWEENGREFFEGIDGDAVDIQAFPWQNDEIVFAWADTRRAAQGTITLGQTIDKNGVTSFATNGKSLSTNEESQQPYVSLSGNNGLNIGFMNTLEGVELLYASKVDANLDPLWNANGIRVYSSGFLSQINPILVEDESNYTYYFWTEYRYQTLPIYYDVFVQKFDANGNGQWIGGGEPLFESFFGDKYVRDAYVAADGNLLVVWNTLTLDGSTLYVSKIDSQTGDVIWTDPLADEEYKQSNSVSCYDATSDELWVAWEDLRNILQGVDIYASQYNSDGVVIDDIPVATESFDQVQLSMSRALDNSGRVMVAWASFENSLQYDIWTRDVNSEIPAEHLTNLTSNETDPSIQVISQDRYIISWTDSRAGIHSDVYFYDSKEGEMANTPNGIPVGATILNQTNSKIIPFADNDVNAPKYLIFWEDRRASGKSELTNLYAQAYFDPTIVGVEDQTKRPETFIVEPAYPNPFNGRVSITVAVDQAQKIQLEIVDITGRNVFSETINVTGGYHTLNWNGLNNAGEIANSGIYFAKISGDVFSHSQKITYIK